MIKANLFLIAFLISNLSYATNETVPSEVNLIGCATAHGGLIHTLSKNEKNEFTATVAFPQYTKDDRTTGVSVPLASDNIFSNNLEF